MKKCVVFLFLMLSLFISGYSQDNYFQTRLEVNLAEAEEFFNSFDYYRAIESYKKVLSDDEGNIDVRLKIADAYFRLNDAKAAIFWYNSALGPVKNRMKVSANHILNYAEVLEQNEKYLEALKWYHFYRARAPRDKRSSKRLETIDKQSSLFADSMRYEIKWMEFNSPYSDFSPAFYEDGIVFASARTEVSNKKKYNYTNSAFLDLYYSKFQDSVLVDAFEFSQRISNDLHEGSAVFYDNYKKMIFTRNVDYLIKLVNDDKYPEELLIHLFYSEKDDNGEWSDPIPLNINERMYSMGHPTITADGKVLYFSSNIPGSYGGTDIYVSHWINGNWSSPENLGPDINTVGNEMFPFIYQDSVLYFSSNGQGGLGGLDIFKVSLNGDPSHRSITNVGYPLNTAKDDFGIIISEDGKTGYFSSNRANAANDDVYQFFVKDPSIKDAGHLVTISDNNKQQTPNVVITSEVKNTSPEEVIKHEIKKEVSSPSNSDQINIPEKVFYYTVQVLALTKPVTIAQSFPMHMKDALKHDYKDGIHRYSYGVYKSQEEAELVLQMVKDEGYADAFIKKIEK